MSKKTPRILTDREPFRLPDNSVSGEGYINVLARIARTGVQRYFGHELGDVEVIEPEKLYRVYRSEADVFSADALESFRDLPITFGHPPEGVSAANYRESAVGHVLGLPKRDGDFVSAELTIRDGPTIAKIKAGEGTQISVGYFADVTLQSGLTPSGEAYDAVQSNIRGNHIALVDAARCGPDCSLAAGMTRDSRPRACLPCQTQTHQPKNKGRPMSELTDVVLIDGEQIPLSEAIDKLKDANSKMAAALKQAEDTIAQLSGDLETKTGEVEALQKSPTGDSDFASRVKARAQMLAQAGAILGDGADLNIISDSDIRKRVINHIYGDGFARGASEHALIGMYKVAVRDAKIAGDTLNGAVSGSPVHSELIAALSRRNDRLSSAWKKGA